MEARRRSGLAARRRASVGNGPRTAMGRTPARPAISRSSGVNADGGIQGHLAQGETQRSGMRLAVTCVSTADVRREEIGELEEAQLAHDAVAVAAGDDAELVARAEMLEHAAGAGH